LKLFYYFVPFECAKTITSKSTQSTSTTIYLTAVVVFIHAIPC
jgi:hypothetical protein